MPVLITHKTTDRLASASLTYTTASVTIPAGELALIAVNSDVNAVVPTVSGLGMTFVQHSTSSGGTNNIRITLFRALSLSDQTGTITITFSSTSNLGGCGWSVVSCASCDQSGVDGAGAIVQAATNNANGTNNLTVTLAAFSSADNATFSCVTLNGNGSITPGTGFTELGEDDDTRSIQSQWRNDNDTTSTWTFSSNFVSAGIAIELKYSAVDLSKRGGGFLYNFI